jgi:hypothetical protein
MNFSCSSTCSIARSRSGRSGWPGGVRCSRQAEWVMRSVIRAFHSAGKHALGCAHVRSSHSRVKPGGIEVAVPIECASAATN